MAAGVVAGAQGAPGGEAVAVHIQGFAFNPALTDVPVGTTVAWDNLDSAPHTVTADDGSFGSATLASGGTYSRAFTSVGTWPYHCNIHPSMTGKIRVVVPGARPDLVVASLLLPDRPPDTTLGQAQPIVLSVSNAGDGVAAGSQVRVSYRYHDALHTIGTAAIPALGPREAAGANFVWDTHLKVGDFPVVAEADSAVQVSEANEANNALEVLASVLVGGVPGVDVLEPV